MSEVEVINGMSLADTIARKQITIINNDINRDCASYHNNYRGKDITEHFADGTFYDRLAGRNGFKPFEDLFAGDTYTMPRAVTATGSDVTGGNVVDVAGFNMHWNNYSGLRFNHATMIPDKHFGKAKMNDTNTTGGGYVGSKMYREIIGTPATSGSTSGTINQQLYAIFGDRLKTLKELLTNSVDTTFYNKFGQNTGASNNYTRTDAQAVLMSEIEVYGSAVWSSSGYDTGTAKTQLPIFKQVDKMTPNDIYYWLKDVVTAASFAHCNDNGYAAYGNASYSYYVRPRFILA